MRSIPGVAMSSPAKPTKVSCRCGAFLFELAADEAVYPKTTDTTRLRTGECQACGDAYTIPVTKSR